MAEYYNVTTTIGDAEIAKAIATNTKLNITHIVFGDGNGSVPTPSKTRTTLVKEVYRQPITKYERHPTIGNWIIIETILPSNIGGFWIREMGVIADGKLISHGSHAPFEKVADPSGVSEYRLKFTLDVRDGNVVAITLDQSLIYATQAWVEENYIKRAEIVDNLETNASNKPLSAMQGKKLQDEKFAKTGGEISSSVQLTSDNSVLTVGNNADIGFVKKTSFKGALAIGKSNSFTIVQSNNLTISKDASDTFTTLMNLDGNGVLWSTGGYLGNSSTASKLQTTRKIFGQDFDGSSDLSGNITANTGMLLADSFHYIDMGRSGSDRMNFNVHSGVFNFINAQNGNIVARLDSNGIDCNAATASKLQNPRKINGVNFDGTGDINITAPMRYLGNANNSTLNSALNDGFYLISDSNILGFYGYGILEVRSTGTTIHQTYFAHTKNSNGSVAVRQTWDSGQNFSAWRSLDPIGSVKLSGAVTGNASFDESGNISIPTNLQVGIGINQYPQDVKASRYSGVVYTNNTGNTITVIITASGSNNTALTHQVSGVQFINTNESLARTVTYHVPNGASYMCTANIILNWVELR
jgi:Phage tail-collar fibre protein